MFTDICLDCLSLQQSLGAVSSSSWFPGSHLLSALRKEAPYTSVLSACLLLQFSDRILCIHLHVFLCLVGLEQGLPRPGWL